MILFLVEAMDHSRFRPSVACLVGSGELLERATPFCDTTHHFRSSLACSPVTIARVASFLRRNRFDVVQTYGLRADVAGRIAARLAGVPAIVSSIRSIDPWRKWYHVLLDKLTSRFVDLVISNSEAGRQASIARGEFHPETIRTIYSGIPHREIPRDRRDQLRAELGLKPEDFPVIAILANLRDMKGHCDVVEALPAIRRKLPGTRFIFAGRDDSKGGIEQMAREVGVRDCIHFPGYVADTPRVLAAADFFMLPSHWEGLPVSVIEAMHAGMPIITTRVGGIPELVRDGVEALLIDPARPDQIESAVERLAGDPELRERLAHTARTRAQTEFSVEAMTAKYQDTYQELLPEKAGQD